MGTLAYGSITIIDIGDFGELSVTPESNQPTLVIYNPDSNVYTPDWSSTPNLILTPVVYYGGQKLLDSSTRTMPTGLTVTWKRQLGSSSATTITNSTANHTITTTGRLQVNANQLNTSNALLTYIVEVAYIEPNSGVTTLTASGQISFGLVKNIQGANAVVFQLYTPNGNVVSNNENNITVSPLLLEGSTDKTSSGTYKWYYYQNGNYNTEITSTSSSSSIYKSGNNLIIKPAAVDSYLSIKCEATYTAAGASSSSTFIAYQSIYDKTDTFQVTVVSTLGDKLINSAGVGIIYTKILRNGELYDEIKSTAVATANNATAFNSAVTKTGVTGADPSNYCWYATSSSLTLYKKSGSYWILVDSASDPHLATYTWTGLHISDNSNASIIGYGKNKAILVNGAIVNKKTMFNVTMTTPST